MRDRFWLFALFSVMAARVLAMAKLPLMDTSEPRYAQIARTMAESGDWITPWFSPGVPFWGKPPLSFWAQALAMQLGGVSELSVRLPSLLVTLVTLWLLYRLAAQFMDVTVARLATLMCASAPLMWVDAGAVITDPFLTLGVTLSLVALPMARVQPTAFWRYGFFVGLAIGLLAKGPLAVVLIGFPAFVWLVVSRDWRGFWQQLPWVSGLLLTALLSVPWYAAAELKTPGFLHYFIIGEHILRFIDPGWQGDLYGNGHQRAHGTIWIYLVIMALPWSLLAIGTGLLRWRRSASSTVPMASLLQWYLMAWTVVCGLLFTPAGNILPTYVQPSLPALSLLAAWWLRPVDSSQRHAWVATVVLLMAIGGGAAAVWGSLHEEKLTTEKSLVQAAQQVPGAPLMYVNSLPYSAVFYSHETVQRLTTPKVAAWLLQQSGPVCVAIAHSRLAALNKTLAAPFEPMHRSKRFALLRLDTQAQRYALAQALVPTLQTPIPDAQILQPAG